MKRALSALAAIGLAVTLVTPMAQAATPQSNPSANDGTLIVRDLPARVRLVPGERVRLILDTNVTTGYSWLAMGGRPQVRVSKGVYTAPTNTNGMVGVSGTTTWTITARQKGRTQVTVVTRPPGAQNTMTDETVGVLTITVM